MRNYHIMNKIYKAVTAVTLTAIIGTSQFGALQAQEGIIDIRGHYYEASIQRMFDQGVLRGYGNGIFAPDQSVTIAQAVQMMVNLFDLNLDAIRFFKEPQATDYFVHADDEAWYEEAFIIAAVYGLPFKAEIDPKALVSVSELANYIIESGRFQGTPYEIYLDYEASDESISRGQAADFLAHALEQLEEQQEEQASSELLASQFGSELVSEIHDNDVNLIYTVTNRTGAKVDLWYSSGQQFDYEIYNEEGALVYQWSNGRMFPMMLVETSLEKDEEMQYKDTWNYTDQEGRKVPAGEYRVQFSTNFYVANTNVRLVSVTEITVQ